MERYFAALGPNAPVRNFAELVAAKKSAVQKTLEAELGGRRRHGQPGLQGPHAEPREAAASRSRRRWRTQPGRDPLSAAEDPRRARSTAADQLERNGTLSNGTGFPAVTFPGGFSTPTASAPLGVPGRRRIAGLGLQRAEAARVTPTRSSRRSSCASRRRARRRCRTSRDGVKNVQE